MQDDTLSGAMRARIELTGLLELVQRDTAAATSSVTELAIHFDQLRNEYDALKTRLSAIEAEVDKLSYEIIPTTFQNQGVKSVKLEGIGNVIVAARWNATMLRKGAAMDWLRGNDAGGLIIETVNASTLAAFAKARALEGEPLPDEIFRVGTAPYTSIRRS